MAVITLINFGLSKQILVLILSFILVLVSLTRVVNGFSDELLSANLRNLNIFVGGTGLAFSLVVIILPELPINTALFLLALGLSFQGIARIAMGSADKSFSNWIRGFLITIGIITLVLSLFVVFFPTTDETILIYVLAYAFLANGIARVVKGIAGYELLEGTIFDRTKSKNT